MHSPFTPGRGRSGVVEIGGGRAWDKQCVHFFYSALGSGLGLIVYADCGLLVSRPGVGIRKTIWTHRSKSNRTKHVYLV